MIRLRCFFLNRHRKCRTGDSGWNNLTDSEVPADPGWMREIVSECIRRNLIMEIMIRCKSSQIVLANSRNRWPLSCEKWQVIVFTPYHMVDYFASQGIKLVLEDNPPDTLSKQLKSFTDWLKVMKKLPVQPSSEKTDEKEAEKIRHFCSPFHWGKGYPDGIHGRSAGPNRECMKRHCPIPEIKFDLSPKSAYFASRIEQLKRLYHDIFRYNPVTGLWFTRFNYPGSESKRWWPCRKCGGFQQPVMGGKTNDGRIGKKEPGYWLLPWFCFVIFQTIFIPKLHPTK